MNTVGAAPTTLDTAALANASQAKRKAVLKETVQEMVGVTFFGQMLKMARNSPLKGEFGHGGRGEEIFGNQLDAEFARRAGREMKNGLSDSIYKRLVKWV